MWKALFQTEHQIALTNTPLISVPGPNGAPAGCCCFLYHLCWHGERQLHGPKALLSLQNRKNTLISDAHWRQKTTQPGSSGKRLQAEEDDNRRFQPVPDHCLRMESSMVRVGGDFLCQQPENMGCLTVSSSCLTDI